MFVSFDSLQEKINDGQAPSFSCHATNILTPHSFCYNHTFYIHQNMTSMQATTGSCKAAKFAGANPLGPMVDPFARMVSKHTTCSNLW
jgi:hypothetical protein